MIWVCPLWTVSYISLHWILSIRLNIQHVLVLVEWLFSILYNKKKSINSMIVELTYTIRRDSFCRSWKSLSITNIIRLISSSFKPNDCIMIFEWKQTIYRFAYQSRSFWWLMKNQAHFFFDSDNMIDWVSFLCTHTVIERKKKKYQVRPSWYTNQ